MTGFARVRRQARIRAAALAEAGSPLGPSPHRPPLRVLYGCWRLNCSPSQNYRNTDAVLEMV